MSVETTSYSIWTCDKCRSTAKTDAYYKPPLNWRTIVIEIIGFSRKLTDYSPQPMYCGVCADKVKKFLEEHDGT